MKRILSLIAVVLFSQGLYAAPTVTVTGQCNREVVPDRIYVVLTARTLEKDASTASKKVAAHYEEIRKEVKKMNLKDVKLQTDNYSVNADWDYSNNKRTLRGYAASMGLRVDTADVEKAGQLLLLSSKLNVQDVSTPVPFLSAALKQKETEECLQFAVKSALGKAEKMATAAGLKVSGLATLNESARQEGYPVATLAMSDAPAKESERQVNFEIAPLSVSVVISATYNLK